MRKLPAGQFAARDSSWAGKAEMEAIAKAAREMNAVIGDIVMVFAYLLT